MRAYKTRQSDEPPQFELSGQPDHILTIEEQARYYSFTGRTSRIENEQPTLLKPCHVQCNQRRNDLTFLKITGQQFEVDEKNCKEMVDMVKTEAKSAISRVVGTSYYSTVSKTKLPKIDELYFDDLRKNDMEHLNGTGNIPAEMNDVLKDMNRILEQEQLISHDLPPFMRGLNVLCNLVGPEEEGQNIKKVLLVDDTSHILSLIHI